MSENRFDWKTGVGTVIGVMVFLVGAYAKIEKRLGKGKIEGPDVRIIKHGEFSAIKKLLYPMVLSDIRAELRTTDGVSRICEANPEFDFNESANDLRVLYKGIGGGLSCCLLLIDEDGTRGIFFEKMLKNYGETFDSGLEIAMENLKRDCKFKFLEVEKGVWAVESENSIRCSALMLMPSMIQEKGIKNPVVFIPEVDHMYIVDGDNREALLAAARLALESLDTKSIEVTECLVYPVTLDQNGQWVRYDRGVMREDEMVILMMKIEKLVRGHTYNYIEAYQKRFVAEKIKPFLNGAERKNDFSLSKMLLSSFKGEKFLYVTTIHQDMPNVFPMSDIVALVAKTEVSGESMSEEERKAKLTLVNFDAFYRVVGHRVKVFTLIPRLNYYYLDKFPTREELIAMGVKKEFIEEAYGKDGSGVSFSEKKKGKK